MQLPESVRVLLRHCRSEEMAAFPGGVRLWGDGAFWFMQVFFGLRRNSFSGEEGITDIVLVTGPLVWVKMRPGG